MISLLFALLVQPAASVETCGADSCLTLTFVDVRTGAPVFPWSYFREDENAVIPAGVERECGNATNRQGQLICRLSCNANTLATSGHFRVMSPINHRRWLSGLPVLIAIDPQTCELIDAGAEGEPASRLNLTVKVASTNTGLASGPDLTARNAFAALDARALDPEQDLPGLIRELEENRREEWSAYAEALIIYSPLEASQVILAFNDLAQSSQILGDETAAGAYQSAFSTTFALQSYYADGDFRNFSGEIGIDRFPTLEDPVGNISDMRVTGRLDSLNDWAANSSLPADGPLSNWADQVQPSLSEWSQGDTIDRDLLLDLTRANAELRLEALQQGTPNQ
jgi:hypothetical protein